MASAQTNIVARETARLRDLHDACSPAADGPAGAVDVCRPDAIEACSGTFKSAVQILQKADQQARPPARGVLLLRIQSIALAC
jgi:hypothetical protein